MVNIKMFYHPNYYKELRKRNKEAVAKLGKSHASLKSDQVISKSSHDGESERAPGPGHKLQATSSKLQAPSVKLSNQPVQAPSDKHQALSNKRQASSHKLQAPLPVNHGTWILEKY